MSSQPVNGRRNPRENQFFEPGVGRKTGVTIAERPRDSEHGMEEMDDLFSPDKPPERSVKRNKDQNIAQVSRNLDSSLSSQDMEVGDSTIPEPQQLLTARKNGRLPIPRTNSPIKTYLASPARRGTSLGPVSSPVRGDVVTPRAVSVSSRVNRKLFSTGDSTVSPSIISPQKRETQAISKLATGPFTNGVRLSPGKHLQPAFEAEDSTMGEAASEAPQSPSILDGPDNSHQFTANNEEKEEEATIPMDDISAMEMTGAEEIDAVEPIDNQSPSYPVIEEKVVEEPILQSKEPSSLTKVKNATSRIITKKTAPQKPSSMESPGGAEIQPIKRGRGRPRKTPVQAEINVEAENLESVESDHRDAEENDGHVRWSRPRRLTQEVGTPDASAMTPKPQTQKSAKPLHPTRASVAAEEEPASKRRQTTAAKKPEAEKKTKRTRKTPPTTESTILQRGPPRPKGHGLYTTRREDADRDTIQTRAGRSVFAPVQYWLGETIEHGNQFEAIESGKDAVFFPKVTAVIRKDEAPIEKRSYNYGKRSANSSKRKREETPEAEDEFVEPWESEPGRIYGEIRTWNPEDPIGVNSEERDEEIALSAAAIITRDIPNSTFKFAKTLTLPFFGSGMVDLPPGALKKPKNSRKMQMVFFVHQGRVNVTVNENTFRIGQGGMWQVPRGNFYSIENDYDKPARIFFSQGCEMEEQLDAEVSQQQ